jgi:hypothetical protein
MRLATNFADIGGEIPRATRQQAIGFGYGMGIPSHRGRTVKSPYFHINHYQRIRAGAVGTALRHWASPEMFGANDSPRTFLSLSLTHRVAISKKRWYHRNSLVLIYLRRATFSYSPRSFSRGFFTAIIPVIPAELLLFLIVVECRGLFWATPPHFTQNT